MKEVDLATGIYRHYKGPCYRVVGVAQHSETEEHLVMYQALYGNKGMWVRPLSMFTEKVHFEGRLIPRFSYVDPQTEVLEVAVLDIKHGANCEFEAAFSEAEPIISGMRGYIQHSLSRCIEVESRYLLLVNWETLRDHETGFHQSEDYERWKRLLHHFYDPFPSVEHFQPVV